MKTIYLFICLFFIALSCQPPVDNSVNEAFDNNSQVVLKYLSDFQSESIDYDSLYSKDVVFADAGYNAQDSTSIDDQKANHKRGWSKYDFKLLEDPVNLLPGVNAETKKADGSVRYYGDWEVTLSATDSTEAKSGVISLYQSFDFDKDGKIVFQQFYGDVSALFMDLNKTE